ncbi:Transglutaminase-like superfamily protein [Planctomycetes bacterium MalM25]|nr:Transglutaminase-like superfamily protein [Planctomycetes bacterium MalM25]
MNPESIDPNDYLPHTEIIDFGHPAVRRRAESLVEGATGEIEQAQRLFEWVRDEIPHTNDINGRVVTCRASEVLEHGTGICYAKSHLLAALCRAVGIPAGFCYQRLRKDPPHEGYELHGFNAIYLSGAGGWVRVDARGNKPGVDARFSLNEERLAFPVDPAAGEVTYPDIWIAPARAVVQTLQSFDRLDSMWPNLPDRV